MFKCVFFLWYNLIGDNMLSEEVIERVSERLVNRIEQGNEYVLKKMGESVKKIGTFKNTNVHDLEQVLKYGGDYEKIVRKLSEITKLNVKDIYKIFEEVAKNDYEFAEQFYKYRNKKYIPWDENVVLQKQVNALAEITAKEYVNLSKTSVLGFGFQNEKGIIKYKGLKETYYDLIDEAILNISQGKETFDDVMYKKLKQIGESGIKVIYPTTYEVEDKETGEIIKKHYVRRLDSAVRMNIKDGIRMLHNETQRQFGKEFDSDGVEVTVHLNPAPDHEQVQGKQFSTVAPSENELSEFDKFQNDEDCYSYDGTFFPATSEETGKDRRSIGEYNCYHYVFSIALGVNDPVYSNKQLQEIIDKNNEGFEFDGKHYTNYEGTQLQRQIELKVREWKEQQILGVSSGNEKLIAQSQEKIRQLTKKYRQLSEASGLQTKMKRMRVSGYKRKKV